MSTRDRRRGRIPQPSATTLFIVAGLPKATDVQVQPLLERYFRRPLSAVHSPSSSGEGELYRQDYVDRLLCASAQFARKRRESVPERVTTPCAIFLLYVPSFDDEKILKAFDFSVFPLPLSNLQIRDRDGKSRRHDPGAVANAIEEAVEQVKGADAAFERIKSLRKRDVALLPPRNFWVSGEGRLDEVLREMRLGRRPWSDRFPEVSPVEFTAESLPGAISGSKVQWCFVDKRGIVFFMPGPGAFHGGQWQSEDESAAASSRILRGLYRFGAPIPAGLHHDAQRSDGAALGGVSFDCDEKGRISGSGTHANIYPNDFVRLAAK